MRGELISLCSFFFSLFFFSCFSAAAKPPGENFCENSFSGTGPKRCAAVRGTTIPGTTACLTATTTSQRTETTTSGSGAWGCGLLPSKEGSPELYGFRFMRECNVRFRALVPARRASGAPNINRPLRPVVASLEGSEAWLSGHHRKPRSVPSCLWLVWKVEKFPRSFRFRSETGWRTARSICWSTLPEAPYSSSIAQGTGSASQSHAGDDEGRCEVRLTAGTLSAPGRSPAARPKPWPHTWHYLAYTPLEKKNIIGIGLERPM